MSFVQFIIPLEVAHDTIAELGQLGDVQFKDVRLLYFINSIFKYHIFSSIQTQIHSNAPT